MSELKVINKQLEAIKKLETEDVKILVDEVATLLMGSELEHVAKSWQGQYKDGNTYKAEIRIKLKQIK